METFLVVKLRRGCYWHLVVRGQGIHKHPMYTGESRTTKDYPAPHVHSTEIEGVLV